MEYYEILHIRAPQNKSILAFPICVDCRDTISSEEESHAPRDPCVYSVLSSACKGVGTTWCKQVLKECVALHVVYIMVFGTLYSVCEGVLATAGPRRTASCEP